MEGSPSAETGPTRRVGRPATQPMTDRAAAMTAMRSIAARRAQTAGPAADSVPVPEWGAELEMLRYLRRHPRPRKAGDEHWQQDLIDGITLVRYLRGGELLALEVNLVVAATEAGIPWQRLRAPLGVRSRQAVMSILVQRRRDHARIEQTRSKATPDQLREQRRRAWLDEHGGQAVEAVRLLLEHRGGLAASSDARDLLDELDTGLRMNRVRREGVAGTVTDLCVLVNELQESADRHASDARAALAAAARIVEGYRAALGPGIES